MLEPTGQVNTGAYIKRDPEVGTSKRSCMSGPRSMLIKTSRLEVKGWKLPPNNSNLVGWLDG